MSSNNCSSCSDSGWFVQMADPDVLDSALLHFFSAYFAEFRSLHCSCAAEVADFPAEFFHICNFDICLLEQRMASLQNTCFTLFSIHLHLTNIFCHFHKCQRCNFHDDPTSSSLSKSQFSTCLYDDQCGPPHPHSPPRRWLHWCGARCRPSWHTTVNLKPNFLWICLYFIQFQILQS